MWSLTTAVLYCTSFVDIFDQTSVAEQVKQLRPLSCDMASCSTGQTVDSTCGTAEIIIIDDEEIEQPRSRAEIYGDGDEPLPEADPLPNDGPLWQWCDGDTVYWHWLDASVQPNYTKLAWQAERVWTKVKDHDAQWNFRAALGLLEWDPTKLPVYAVIVKMAVLDSDNKTKVLMLLLEPGGTRGWDTLIIKTLRRCVYTECYRSHMVDTEFPLFKNVQQLRLVVRALVTWVLAKPARLSDIFNGRWQDLRLM